MSSRFKLYKLIDKLFRRTILLKPTAYGYFEAIDITSKVEPPGLYRDGEKSMYIVARPIRGLPRVSQIAIQSGYDSAECLDLFSNPGHHTITEGLLGKMLHLAELAGQEQAVGPRSTDRGQLLTLLAAAAAAGLSLMIYLKIQAIPT